MRFSFLPNRVMTGNVDVAIDTLYGTVRQLWNGALYFGPIKRAKIAGAAGTRC